jgi:hypothetical protein
VAYRRAIIKEEGQGEVRGTLDYLGVKAFDRSRRQLPFGEVLSALILTASDSVWHAAIGTIKDPPSVAAVTEKRKQRKREKDREYRREKREAECKGWKALEAFQERRKAR